MECLLHVILLKTLKTIFIIFRPTSDWSWGKAKILLSFRFQLIKLNVKLHVSATQLTDASVWGRRFQNLSSKIVFEDRLDRSSSIEELIKRGFGLQAPVAIVVTQEQLSKTPKRCVSFDFAIGRWGELDIQLCERAAAFPLASSLLPRTQ